MLDVVIVYAGLMTVFAGLIIIATAWLRWARWSWRRGLAVTAAGAAVVVFGMLLPAGERRITLPVSALDDFTPVFQFSEVHHIDVDATPAEVYRAVRSVTASEIRFFKTLTWIRRFGRRGPEHILNAPDTIPLLDVATRTTFLSLVDRPDSEVVVGTIVHKPRGSHRITTAADFRQLQKPGFAKAAMNFRMTATPGGGTHLSTETRVYATDDASRRRFAMYWRLIYPGSALIRREWLRAVKRRAESHGAG